MGRRIVFFGNCQAQTLSRFYLDQLSDGDDKVDAIFFTNEDEGNINLLRTADIVIEQIFSGPNDVVSRNISADCRRIPYPMALGPFLWPYASEAHIHNQLYDFAPHLPGGPWPVEAGDSQLNRMIASGTPTDTAVSAYLGFDIVKRANLDRLLELHLEAQRQRDEIAGFDIASIVEAHFRKEQLFASRGHPHERLYHALVEGVFRNFGFAQSVIEEGLSRMPETWLDRHVQPMHPRLIEHYRLEWIEPEATYFSFWTGSRTFEEWCRQYMDYDWNRDLHEGFFLLGHQDRGDPLPYLERGLARSPSSTFGLQTLAELLMHRGRQAEAEVAMRRAAQLDPAEMLPRLAGLLRQCGKLDDAEEVLRRIIMRSPKQPAAYFSLAELLGARGGGTEAVDLVSRGAALLRHKDPNAHCTVGQHLLRTSQFAEAEQAFRAALEAVATHRGALWGLAETLLRQGRAAEAHETLRQLREIEPDEPQTDHRIGVLLSRFGDPVDAVTCFRAVLAKQPEYPGAREELAQMLGRNPDTVEEAMALLRPLAQPGTRNFRAIALMGHLSNRAGDIAGGVEYFRAALDILPHNTDAMMALANDLTRLGRAGEIAPWYARYREAGGSDSALHNRIGEIMQAAGELAIAETRPSG